MRIGVALLTFRSGEAVGPTLTSVAESTRTPDLLCVVDNASGDETVAFVERTAPAADVVVLASNNGYGPAMNVALRRLAEAGADVVVFLTHDVVLGPECLALLESAFSDETVGAVGPLLTRTIDPTVVWSGGGRLAGWRAVPRHVGSGERTSSWSGREPYEAAWLDGAVLAVRTSAFLQVGGFREDLFLYWEDVDLSLRLTGAGWRLSVVPSALAGQEPSWTPPYLMARNMVMVMRAHRGAMGVVAACVDAVGLAVRDTVRRRRSSSGRSVALLRAAGLADGLRGRLDRRRALERYVEAAA